MEYSILVNNRKVKVVLKSINGDKVIATADGKEYELDVVQAADKLYSVIWNTKSYSIDVSPKDKPREYEICSHYNFYTTRIEDPRKRFGGNIQQLDHSNELVCPMPGKVVKVLVKKGDHVTAGQTLVVVEAMKMQSEYKATKAAKVTKTMVADGDTIKSQQVLVVLEYDKE